MSGASYCECRIPNEKLGADLLVTYTWGKIETNSWLEFDIEKNILNDMTKNVLQFLLSKGTLFYLPLIRSTSPSRGCVRDIFTERPLYSYTLRIHLVSQHAISCTVIISGPLKNEKAPLLSVLQFYDHRATARSRR